MLHFSEKNKKNAFKTPENYFDNFQDDLQIRISEEKISEYFGKNNPFVVPENYFKEIDKEINQRIKREPGKSRNLYQQIKPYLTLAASVIIIFGVWRAFLNLSENYNKKETDKISEVLVIQDNQDGIELIIKDTAVVEKHIEEYISDESETVIADMIVDEADSIVINFEFNDDDSELIAEYIADNLDYYDIIEQ